MQPLPTEFLEILAQQHELSSEQKEAFVAHFGSDRNEQQIAEDLCISETALRTRMSGVYKKFSIGGKGPGKLRKLHDFLIQKPGFSPPLSEEPEISGRTPVSQDPIAQLVQET